MYPQLAHGRNLLRGAARYIRDYHPNVLLKLLDCACFYKQEDFNDFDGVITCVDDAKLGSIDPNYPLICLGKEIKGQAPYDLQVRHELIGELAAELLLDLGVVTFAYYDGSRMFRKSCSLRSDHRLLAYKKKITESISPLINSHFEVHRPGDFESLRAWISKLVKPAGIFAYNDLGALLVSEACEREGIQIPNEVSIVGVDNDRLLCVLNQPHITSIDSRAESIGYEGMHLLLERIRYPGLPHDLNNSMTPKAYRRESTGTSSCEHAVVRPCLDLIEKLPVDELTPTLLAEKSNISLRKLEAAFRKNTDKTIQDTIISERVRRAKRLLRDTNKSFEQIAESLDQVVGNLRKQFKRFTEMNPQQYREVFHGKRNWSVQNPVSDRNSNQLSVCILSGLMHQAAREVLFGVELYINSHEDVRIALNDGTPSSGPSLGLKKSRQTFFESYDGFLVLPNASIPAELLANKPVVCLDHSRDAPMSLTVGIDNQYVGALAAKHFLFKGYRCFAYCEFFGADTDLDNSIVDTRKKDRYIGYKNELLDQGISEETIHRKVYKDLNDLANWLKQLPKHTAILAFSDQLAVFITIACSRMGISVPGDIAVLGVDNDELFNQLARPSISSIDVDFKAIGYTAMESLVDMIQGKMKPPFGTISFLPRFIAEKKSTCQVATDNQALHRAIQFMQENLESPISSKEIAEASNISRRAMEYEFKGTLNTSPKAYLESMRINEIQRLLILSDYTVGEIAEIVGFNNSNYLTRVFKARIGVKPLDFRRARAGIK
ncbi:substrate-binding domain-containing protein [Rubellicoccus peritrichatus]|uniref:Substrate-binding domain-containing protein n=1 Tax=Rubellicoccus peritrichatus TaxID=3080537 RepID=A0AAQ3LBT7_9BACT|nr:substrate-binding domain-containing protein [Puniceicoccus sp. CR14]WOO40603.1 substrate-binding domain-containing protein [Puniceicoccus sp. CR14]